METLTCVIAPYQIRIITPIIIIIIIIIITLVFVNLTKQIQ